MNCVTSKRILKHVNIIIRPSVIDQCLRHTSTYEERRVVVTGLGTVTPLGVNVPSAWRRLIDGQCAVRKIEDGVDEDEKQFLPIYSKLPSRIAARIPLHEFNDLKSKHFTSADSRVMSKAMMLGVLAVDEALKDSGWFPKDPSSMSRTGVAVGNAMVDLDYIAASHNLITNKAPSKLSPYFVPRILPNLSPGHISIRYGFLGPNHSVSTACATGSHAIGDAFNFIKTDAADVMLAGGVDTCINPLSMSGFCRARALATKYNDRPELSSRPFDKDRDGFVMGEGGAILLLEELEHALARNAKIYCEVVGYGLSGDANHITAGRADGEGALLAIKGAFRKAKLRQKSELWCVNAHATSTPLGDAAELTAIQKFVRHLKENPIDDVTLPDDGKVFVTSHKGNFGHLIGACGSAETAFAALALKEGRIPRTLNVENVDETLDENLLKLVSGKVEEKISNDFVKLILKNSFGFGGTNVSLLLSEFRN